MAATSPDTRSILSNKDTVGFVFTFGGGYAALTYILGYLYWLAYLDVFGAVVLFSQVPVAEVLFGSASVAMPLVLFVAAFVLEHKVRPAEVQMARLAHGSFVVIVIIWGIEALIGNRFVDSARSNAYAAVSYSAMVSAFACCELGLAALRDGRTRRVVLALGAFVINSFFILPIAAGLSTGFCDVANADRELAQLHLAGQPTKDAYVLFITADGAYCVAKPIRSPRSILVVPWSSVRSLSGIRKIRRHEDVE